MSPFLLLWPATLRAPVPSRGQARRQRGVSLVEMGVALAILGVLVTVAVGYWQLRARHEVSQSVRSATHDARAALLAYAQARFRLPCPDTDGDGEEGSATDPCPAGVQVGGFPWKTVGVLDPGARALRYGVFRAEAASAGQDADLTRALDRYTPLVAQGTPMAATELTLGQSNLLDLCRALELAQRPGRPVDAARLHVWQVGQASTRQPVAYVLASGGLLDADGVGGLFDGANASASSAQPAFERAARAASADYDDVVLAASFSELFGDLGCGSGLSAIGHTHANAALSAAMLRQGMHDYRQQLKLLADAAGASVAAGTAKQLMTGAALSKALATSLDQAAFVLTTQGTTSAILATGVLAVVANTASTVTAAAALASTIAFKVEADSRYANVGPLVSLIDALHSSVDANFRQADTSGF